ncbi:uncharacterized protein LOC129220679 [Uloborus diversus]|uniref:uncharacterized protein LOC129220679 n=1 Tax=Uloborus diversus TaxID=327109 RepID=UPI0024099599|nr:uncharacterized protein LOC129220679 [Uloborus diversus]
MIAWCLRFIKNAPYPKNRNIGYLTSDEMKAARNILVKIVQKQEFSTEYIHLENKKPLPANSKLLSLKPFINEDGVIRDGGRLENAPFSNERKHPILMPKNHHLTTIIIRSYHETYLHAGTILLLSVIRIWEAAVKSAKSHLKRTIADQKLTLEEFSTLTTQIESCLNSRPLSPLSEDPSEMSALTPGHFLVGTSLSSIPEENLLNEKIPPSYRWKLTQQIFQSFWKRWLNEYVSALQQRSKWVREQPNIKVNDLVLIKEDNVPPLRWRLGRVMEVFPGSDQNVRVVNIKTDTGFFRRPIYKVAVLPNMD